MIAAAALAGEPSRGHLVLIGGGERPHAAMRRFVELAGGPSAPIVVLPTASELAETGPAIAAELASEHGCSDVAVLEVRSCADANRADYIALAERASGIYFSGGDQTRIINALEGSLLLATIAGVHARGAVIAGTSAGTACQSPLMITGEGDFSVIKAGAVELWQGLGFFPGVIVDQHFIARRRENRLFTVILEHPELLGVGVDEDTAVWVRPDGTFEVIGESSVMVIDASAATIDRRGGADGHDPLGAHDLKVSILLSGEVYDLARRRVVTEPRAQR